MEEDGKTDLEPDLSSRFVSKVWYSHDHDTYLDFASTETDLTAYLLTHCCCRETRLKPRIRRPDKSGLRVRNIPVRGARVRQQIGVES
jgi:hypothetical protein